jgi:Ca2+-binding EF-hand superfamily protein
MKFVIAVAFLFSAACFAQSTRMEGAPGSKPRASMDERINRLDTNKDGMISRDEAAKYPRLAKAFNRIDSNKDNLLSRDELMAFRDKAKSRRSN